MFHEAEEERQKTGGVRRYLGAPMQAVAQEVQKHVPFVSTANVDVNNPEDGDLAKNGNLEDGDHGIRQRRKTSPSATKPDLDPMMREFNPEKYQRYKKKLKLAVMEYYKELEILKNYRVG